MESWTKMNQCASYRHRNWLSERGFNFAETFYFFQEKSTIHLLRVILQDTDYKLS